MIVKKIMIVCKNSITEYANHKISPYPYRSAVRTPFAVPDCKSAELELTVQSWTV